MIKRLAILCCILLVPTMAFAASNPTPTTNYGDWWVGTQGMGVFTLNRSVSISENGFTGNLSNVQTDAAFGVGAIFGFNFSMANRRAWERYFGLALDFSWNQFNQKFVTGEPRANGNQYALTFLFRGQYPLKGDETFTRGRVVPFVMLGPSIVWSQSSFTNLGGSNRTATSFGIVAEIGMEFFVAPRFSIGPSVRYCHVFGPNFTTSGVKIDSNLDQFSALGRLAFHF